MPEPLTSSLGIAIVKEAFARAMKYFDDADKIKVKNAEACANYLKAILESVAGLQNAYDRFLTDALHCDLDDKAEVRALLKNIDYYLREDHLRKVLLQSMSGLEQCQEVLEKSAESFAQWPAIRAKQEVLMDLTNLLDRMKDFAASLEEGRPIDTDNQEISGVGFVTLMNISKFLDGTQDGGLVFHMSNQEPRKAVLQRAISTARRERNKTPFLELIKDIERLSQRLLQNFA